MVINILETKDLLELSLLKCKICCRRLQSPILQVSGFDNVCGSCTSDSNAKRNVDLEALLEKLYLPCNYAESGCKFEGNFDDVCIHEKVCCFQELKCPLAPYGQCNGDLDNIVEHIESKHPDNVLKVVANHVYVRNPNAEKTTAIYLFAVDNLRFVLSAKLDAKKDQISYAFYCLNYDVNMDDVKISIPLKDDNLNCNVEIIHVKQLGKGEVPSMFYEKNVIKMKCIILEIFGCSDTITIRIDITKSVALVEETDELCNSFAGSWYKCSFCSKAAKNIHYCNRTHRIVCCEKCFKGDYHFHCSCSPNNSMSNSKTHTESITIHSVLNLDSFKPNRTLQCGNTGCNKEIYGLRYESHSKLECRFRQVNCSFSTSTSCEWTGTFTDFIAHLTEDHADRVNQNSCEILNTNGTSQQLCFVKQNKTFLQTYQIGNNQQLAVTTSVIDVKGSEDISYKWLIYLKNSVNGCETLVTNVCTNEEEKTTIDITDYVTDVPFTLKVLFRRVGDISE